MVSGVYCWRQYSIRMQIGQRWWSHHVTRVFVYLRQRLPVLAAALTLRPLKIARPISPPAAGSVTVSRAGHDRPHWAARAAHTGVDRNLLGSVWFPMPNNDHHPLKSDQNYPHEWWVPWMPMFVSCDKCRPPALAPLAVGVIELSENLVIHLLPLCHKC